jgi:pyruvate,water dikinase
LLVDLVEHHSVPRREIVDNKLTHPVWTVSVTAYVLSLDEVGLGDVARVGGKNASIGEMLRALTQLGVRVPRGFATTADAYREFLKQGGLDQRISSTLAKLNIEDVKALAGCGKRIREWILATPFPPDLRAAVLENWRKMDGGAGIAVAVRSSATAEDLPEASFAGQQETFLNVRGETALLRAMHEVYASLFTDRAISYRVHQQFNHDEVALSVGVQHMARSDLGSSGVMFTLDTDSGFRDVVFVTSAYGLGELVVQGAVNPDEFYVYKPGLRAGHRAILRRNLGSKAIKMIYAEPGEGVRTVAVPEAERARFSLPDSAVEELARLALVIEQHYGCPMDIEWAYDGSDQKLYILQARPETVHSRVGRVVQRFTLRGRSKVIAEGRSIGARIGSGRARVVRDASSMALVQAGDILVADMTDPDWEPVMKRAAAIVTNRGGRTCHAAIIARELGVPAVVGCGNATQLIRDGQEITVSCAEGDTGFIYEGLLDFEQQQIEHDTLPAPPVRIMMNVANPDRAFAFAALPHQGVGLARLEFIINRMIGVHPRALLEFERQEPALKETIRQRIAGYADPVSFFVDRLSEGIAQIAAAFAPEPVIVRLSDFKSNEYANLIGGAQYEPHEENPMLGFRGAARYVDTAFRPCFELECAALRRVREDMGLRNVQVMVPFVRTVAEAKQVTELLAANGLKRGLHDLKLIMMCELPSNALLADSFLQYFDGMSIGSNDLTQLTLGVDRDSALVAGSFDERDGAVQALMTTAIAACRKQGKYIGICGQGPSDHPDLARWLVDQGIDSLSLNPDTVVATWLLLAGVSG